MKHIFLNLKRFDISPQKGGVNRIAPMKTWGSHIIESVRQTLDAYPEENVNFVIFMPESHLLNASSALAPESSVKLGCQGVYRQDTSPGGNFGAFTTNRTANAARELGCSYAIIGHCEERDDKAGILAEAGTCDPKAVNRILNREVLAAQAAGLSVLYCIGEKADEHKRWQEVLGLQLKTGLAGADVSRITIAYEPVWSIGPGKTPAGKEYIQQVAGFIKEQVKGADVVYGGGLKHENAEMLASIPEIDGGLIALTRFSGEIGFYPEEYLEIVSTYMNYKERESL